MSLPLAILAPAKLEPQKFKAFLLGLSAVKRDHSCLFCRQLQPEFLQPLPQYSVKSFGIVLPLEGTNKIVRVSNQTGFASTVLLHHVLEPLIQTVMQINVGQNR